MTNIILHGCNGKMGQVISANVEKIKGLKIVAGIDKNTTPLFDYPVFESLEDCQILADVIIDFSIAPAVPNILRAAIDKRMPIIVCTTGLDEETKNLINQASKKIPVLFSANMSLGVNLLADLVQKAAKTLKGFDIEIIEKHHNQKLDAPSGTALYIADTINEALDQKYDYVYDRTKKHQKRGQKEIGISAIRGGNLSGEHRVLFIGEDEVVELSHIANSKSIFANGAIKAAIFLKDKPAGLYSMGDVIDSL